MLRTFSASTVAITRIRTVITRTRISIFCSGIFGYSVWSTLLEKRLEAARRELSAELMIAEISALRKTVSRIGWMSPRT